MVHLKERGMLLITVSGQKKLMGRGKDFLTYDTRENPKLIPVGTTPSRQKTAP